MKNARLVLIVSALAACGGSNDTAPTTTSHKDAGTGVTTPTGDAGGSGQGDDDDDTLSDGGGPTLTPDGSIVTTNKDGGSIVPVNDGGQIVGSTGVTVYSTPSTTLATQMAAVINAATKSVHMTMYLLNNTDIINALTAKGDAGLDVKVILNQTFPTGTTDDNPATATTLQAHKVGVVWRNGPPNATAGAYTHEKTFIVDGKQAWIGTMNFEYSSFLYNREYVVEDNDAADVAEAEDIFNADYTGAVTADTTPLVVSPTNSRASMVALINSAKKTLDIENEEFSDNAKGGVVAAIAAAASRGVATRVILANESPLASTETTAIATVKAAGAKVVISGGTSGSATAKTPYIHAKTIVVDCVGIACTSAFIGSENISGGSLGYNRELGVVITNATEIAKVETAINTDFAIGVAQ